MLLKMLFEHLGLFRLFSIQFLFLVLYVVHFTATCILFTKKKNMLKNSVKGEFINIAMKDPFHKWCPILHSFVCKKLSSVTSFRREVLTKLIRLILILTKEL